MAKSNPLPPSLAEADRLLAAVEQALVRQSRRARNATADALDAVATRSKHLRRRFHDLAESPKRHDAAARSRTVAATADLFDAVLHQVEHLLSGGAEFIAPAAAGAKSAKKSGQRTAARRSSSKRAPAKKASAPRASTKRASSKKASGRKASAKKASRRTS